MKRLLLLFVFVSFSAKAQEAISLKEKITVTDATLTLNDLFQSPVPQGQVAVFSAPAPGKSGMISAAHAIEAAKSYGVSNIVTPAAKEITVEREAHAVTPSDIENVIAQKAAQQAAAMKAAQQNHPGGQ